MHSEDDVIVPPAHAAVLYERRSPRLWRIREIGHISALGYMERGAGEWLDLLSCSRRMGGNRFGIVPQAVCLSLQTRGRRMGVSGRRRRGILPKHGGAACQRFLGYPSACLCSLDRNSGLRLFRRRCQVTLFRDCRRVALLSRKGDPAPNHDRRGPVIDVGRTVLQKREPLRAYSLSRNVPPLSDVVESLKRNSGISHCTAVLAVARHPAIRWFRRLAAGGTPRS